MKVVVGTWWNPFAWARWGYDLSIGWGEHRWALGILFGVAVIEAIFFPVPPDILIIAICLSRPDRAVVATLIGAVGSVFGGIASYAIGYWAMDSVGTELIHTMGLQNGFERIQDVYRQWDFWAVFAAGFTPVPYKLFTLAAGAMSISFPWFVGASFVSRGLRYGIEAALLYYYGDRARIWIERRFNLLTLALMLLLILLIVVQRL